MSGTIWPAQIKQVCVKMAREGFNPSQIHTATGVPRQTIIGWLQKARLLDGLIAEKLRTDVEILQTKYDDVRLERDRLTAERDELKETVERLHKMRVEADRRWADELSHNVQVIKANRELTEAYDTLKTDLTAMTIERDELKSALASEREQHATEIADLNHILIAERDALKAEPELLGARIAREGFPEKESDLVRMELDAANKRIGYWTGQIRTLNAKVAILQDTIARLVHWGDSTSQSHQEPK